MDMNVGGTNQPRASHGLPAGDKTSRTAQAAETTVPEPGRIAERAYELYVQRDRQDGRALEDWFEAEQQLRAAAGHK